MKVKVASSWRGHNKLKSGWFWLWQHSQWPYMLWAGWYCLQLLLDQLHNNNTEFHGWVGGPGHYVVTPTRGEVELRLSWAVTIGFTCLIVSLWWPQSDKSNHETRCLCGLVRYDYRHWSHHGHFAVSRYLLDCKYRNHMHWQWQRGFMYLFVIILKTSG